MLLAQVIRSRAKCLCAVTSRTAELIVEIRQSLRAQVSARSEIKTEQKKGPEESKEEEV